MEAHADYKVGLVRHGADLRVKFVEHFPDDPGEWQAVEHHEDFSVEIVDSGEDFTVELVEQWPGCRAAGRRTTLARQVGGAGELAESNRERR